MGMLICGMAASDPTSAPFRSAQSRTRPARHTALRALYLFVWREIHPDAGEGAIAFTTAEGTPVDPHDLKSYLREIAGARRNAANGFICRSLLDERRGALPRLRGRQVRRERREVIGWKAATPVERCLACEADR
jgi:hypothetical protein